MTHILLIRTSHSW